LATALLTAFFAPLEGVFGGIFFSIDFSLKF